MEGIQSTQNREEIEAALQAACEELNAELKANPGCKPNLSAASRHHSLKYSTLQNHFQGHTKLQKEAHGCQQCISPKQEVVLVAWLKHLGTTGHLVCKCMIRHRVALMCGKKPGQGWVYHFLGRHSQVVLSKPSGLDPKCARAFNRPSVQRYFDKLEEIVNHFGVPSENIYNMDEKGCQRGGGKDGSGQKFFFSCEVCAKYKFWSANLKLVTIIKCISADGKDLWPGFVFEGYQYDPEWFKTDH